MKRSIIALLIGVSFVIALGTAQGQVVEWTRVFGSAGFDVAWSIAVDDEDVFVYGEVEGTLPGQSSAGGPDLFLRKLDEDGNEVWTRQFGSPGPDFIFGSSSLAVDSGDPFVVGRVLGALPGQTHAGFFDAFLQKFDEDGNVEWTRQFGTPGFDDLHGVAVDDNDVFVVGSTDVGLPGQPFSGDFDVIVQRYDNDGNLIWTRQFGTPGPDHSTAVAVDDDAVFVGGFVGGALPSQTSAGFIDAFLRKFDTDGNLIWTRQFGTPGFDDVFSVTADDGEIFVTGVVEGALPGQSFLGANDVYVRKYDSDGNLAWTRQFGTPSLDFANIIAAEDGIVFVGGSTLGTLPGQTTSGLFDAWLRQLDSDGNEIFTIQFGTDSFDGVFSLGFDDPEDDLFVAGGVGGPFGGQPYAGGLNDAFVQRLSLEDVDDDEDG